MRCAHRSRVPGECSERPCASGTRPGTQRRKSRSAIYSCRPGSRVSLRSPGTREWARARRVRSRGARSEPLAVIPIHDVKQRSVLRSRGALLRPGFVLRDRVHPRRGVDGAPTGALSLLSRLRDATIRRVGAARPDRDARLSALHRGDFRPGAALPSPALPPEPYSELLAPGHHAWRAVSRTSRARGYAPRPQDATPRSAFQDRLRKTPLHERGWQIFVL